MELARTRYAGTNHTLLTELEQTRWTFSLTDRPSIPPEHQQISLLTNPESTEGHGWTA